jgi:hypothetical protein
MFETVNRSTLASAWCSCLHQFAKGVAGGLGVPPTTTGKGEGVTRVYVSDTVKDQSNSGTQSVKQQRRAGPL